MSVDLRAVAGEVWGERGDEGWRDVSENGLWKRPTQRSRRQSRGAKKREVRQNEGCVLDSSDHIGCFVRCCGPR
jgi:hypothetical protein